MSVSGVRPPIVWGTSKQQIIVTKKKELCRLFTKGTGFRLKSFFPDGDRQNSRWETHRALTSLQAVDAERLYVDALKAALPLFINVGQGSVAKKKALRWVPTALDSWLTSVPS